MNLPFLFLVWIYRFNSGFGFTVSIPDFDLPFQFRISIYRFNSGFEFTVSIPNFDLPFQFSVSIPGLETVNPNPELKR